MPQGNMAAAYAIQSTVGSAYDLCAGSGAVEASQTRNRYAVEESVRCSAGTILSSTKRSQVSSNMSYLTKSQKVHQFLHGEYSNVTGNWMLAVFFFHCLNIKWKWSIFMQQQNTFCILSQSKCCKCQFSGLACLIFQLMLLSQTFPYRGTCQCINL